MSDPRETPQLILDVGTHKILGLVVRPSGDRPGDQVEVLAASLARHTERSMRDGQVHDVASVARTVRRVVDELERTVGRRFDGARVAAAGRALKTARGRAESHHATSVTVTAEMERVLTWEAVADAQTRLMESLPPAEQARGYYAVAHSVTGCWLDGDAIGALAGQRGRHFALEVLATFLPGVVVDSLESVLAEAGLEMKSMTLEPIAALEAVIPPTSRHLRLALVDIGAGTSDIALTGGGRVEAFAMVPQAGDAITEAVSTALLLDFHLAEQVKRRVSAGETATVESVLGEEVSVDPPLLLELIAEPTERLVQAIAGEIFRWAPERPDAVILVGGGSRTPRLAELLAAALDLPPQRVVVRDRRAVRGAVGAEHLSGPDVITGLGIALRAVRGEEMPPVRVRVNGRPVCLFLPDRCTVREAARVAGLSPAELAGRLGPGITITVNGRIVAVPGSRGEPAVARIGGRVVPLDSLLKNQDEVELTPPRPGLPARPTVAEIVELWMREQRLEHPDGRPGGQGSAEGGLGHGALVRSRPRLRLRGEWQEAPVWVSLNGRPARMDETVKDRDVLEIRWPRTAKELLEALGESASPGACYVNGRAVSLAEFAGLLRNGEPAELSDPVEDGDTWEWEALTPTAGELVRRFAPVRGASVAVTVNGRELSIEQPVEIAINGAPASPDDAVRSGDRVDVRVKPTMSLYEVLPFAGIAWTDRARDGRRLVLKVNDAPADFTTVLTQGDRISIEFE